MGYTIKPYTGFHGHPTQDAMGCSQHLAQAAAGAAIPQKGVAGPAEPPPTPPHPTPPQPYRIVGKQNSNLVNLSV